MKPDQINVITRNLHNIYYEVMERYFRLIMAFGLFPTETEFINFVDKMCPKVFLFITSCRSRGVRSISEVNIPFVVINSYYQIQIYKLWSYFGNNDS